MKLSLAACLALTVLAGAAVLGTYFLFGVIALAYPLGFLGWLFLILLGSLLNAAVQASVNPGLENLRNPSFWLSAVGNAYWYATDKRRWMLYVSLFAFVSSVVLITPLGFILVGAALAQDAISSLGAAASWLAGVFLSSSVTVTLITLVPRNHPQVNTRLKGVLRKMEQTRPSESS